MGKGITFGTIGSNEVDVKVDPSLNSPVVEQPDVNAFNNDKIEKSSNNFQFKQDKSNNTIPDSNNNNNKNINNNQKGFINSHDNELKQPAPVSIKRFLSYKYKKKFNKCILFLNGMIRMI